MNIIARIMNQLGIHLQYRLRITRFNYERSANLHPDAEEGLNELTV